MLSQVLDDWAGANVSLLRVINDFQAPWWHALMMLGTWLTDPYPFPVLAGVSCAAALVLCPRLDRARIYEIVLTLGAAYVLVSGVVWLVKIAVALPRPFDVLGADMVRVMLPPRDPFSFPSGHAARATLLVASLWPCLSGRWRAAAVVLAAWVGLSRISLGLHFPADVLGGVVVGVVVPALVRRTVAPLVKRVLAQREHSMTRPP